MPLSGHVVKEFDLGQEKFEVACSLCLGHLKRDPAPLALGACLVAVRDELAQSAEVPVVRHDDEALEERGGHQEHVRRGGEEKIA